MAYIPLTPAEFKTAKPQFADVPDPTVQMYIDMAGRLVDKSWTEGDYTNAWIALTCHFMTLDGLGTDAASKGFKAGAAFYSSIRSGQLTLTRYRERAAADTDFNSWLKQTPCGQYYLLLLRLNKYGPRVITTGVGACASPYAKDQPVPGWGGWPNDFWS